MSACATTLIVIATILGPVTLVFMSVSFGTDHWLEIEVKRNNLDATIRGESNGKVTGSNTKQSAQAFARFSHDRDRGIFRECYPGNDTAFLDVATGVEDGNCFDVEYELEDDREDESDYFMIRLHLNRCFLAFYIIAIAVFLLAYVFGLILCCMRISRWAYIAGLCSYCAAFSLAAAIAFFHGAEYIERNKLQPWEIYSFTKGSYNWGKVEDETDRRYGWSYALAWVGMVLGALTATFYSLAGCYLTSERYEDREVLEKHRGRDYPIAMEPVYAVGADPYYTKQYGYRPAYVGPMAPDYYGRGAYPAITYPDPNKDMTWGWREMES